jgi:hypothetical protein
MGHKQPLAIISAQRLVSAYSVEKLCITTTRKFIGIFRLPGAQVTDQWCRSELRQAGFSCDFCCPLVHTVRNAAQIAIYITAHFKTEFFNRIDPKRPLETVPISTTILNLYLPCRNLQDLQSQRRGHPPRQPSHHSLACPVNR